MSDLKPVEPPKANAVRMSDLAAWLKKNLHRTWYIPEFGKPGHLRQIKYLKPNIDTRDMEVWRIEIDGYGDVKSVSTHDEFNGTILELLEKKLDEQEAKFKARWAQEEADRGKALEPKR